MILAGFVSQSPRKHRRVISFGFLLSIPICFLLFGVFSLAIVARVSTVGLDHVAVGWFALGFLIATVVFQLRSFRIAQTFVHEMKHAALVILSGGKVHKVRVNRDTGVVQYELPHESSRYEPMILMAPYCAPVLTLPAYIFACVSYPSYVVASTLLLGLAAGCDLSQSWQDLHEHQTDLKKIRGGPFVTIPFIAAVNLFWFSTLALWIVAKNEGFKLAYQLIVNR